jgi:hypothetical protein
MTRVVESPLLSMNQPAITPASQHEAYAVAEAIMRVARRQDASGGDVPAAASR